MYTTSTQKYLGRSYSFNIVLASSSSQLLILSTTPFYCGVLGAKTLCTIPYFSKNILNLSF